MADYFFCHACDDCFPVDCFPYCELCYEHISPDHGECYCGYVCQDHIKEIIYKDFGFVLCVDCNRSRRRKNKITLKELDEKVEEKKKEKEEEDIVNLDSDE